MIKDISHADVGKDDIDNVDATYDDYYDVSQFKLSNF